MHFVVWLSPVGASSNDALQMMLLLNPVVPSGMDCLSHLPLQRAQPRSEPPHAPWQAEEERKPAAGQLPCAFRLVTPVSVQSPLQVFLSVLERLPDVWRAPHDKISCKAPIP